VAGKLSFRQFGFGSNARQELHTHGNMAVAAYATEYSVLRICDPNPFASGNRKMKTMMKGL
jgi:hypothetical protein